MISNGEFKIQTQIQRHKNPFDEQNSINELLRFNEQNKSRNS